jgi:myosin heavy chain 6/7
MAIFPPHSYMILAPAIMQAEADPKVAAAKCLEAVELDPESYRVGHTKVQSEPLKPLAQFS